MAFAAVVAPVGHITERVHAMTKDEDLYLRLHSLSKSLEGSGRIDEHENPDAYATVLDAMNFVARERRQVEVLRAERDHARARTDAAVKIIVGIHSLLYPPRVKLGDGRTMQFHQADANEWMQALSDKIRALPDELVAIDAARTP